MDRLHIIDLLHDHLTKIRHHRIQLSTLHSLEKVADFSSIIKTTVTVVCNALHYCVLFLVECNIRVPISSFLCTIIMRVLQLSFCFCSLPGHIVRAKKLLLDVKEHSSIILHTLYLFYIYISVHVCENL